MRPSLLLLLAALFLPEHTITHCEPLRGFVAPVANVMTNSKDKFSIHSKAVVCQDVDLRGDITIGSGSWFIINCGRRGYVIDVSFF